MRVSFNWLAELVELPKGTTPEQTAAQLTAMGLEVEAIEDLAAPLAGVVVARVARVEPHPTAPPTETGGLSVCTVEAGGAPLTIVCGAKNVAEGQLVCLAPVGTHLPALDRYVGGVLDFRFVIGERAVKGVASQGMLCSAQELGLPWSTEGILVLPQQEGVSPGAPVAPALGREDVVLTLGVTPNRPDALSHMGVARELCAAFKTRMRAQAPTCAERGGPIDDVAHVAIEDLEGCPRYACRVIEGVMVQPSPLWLVARLAACGVRSVNNVVDVTNLVMMERGIPLHAFDCDKIGKETRSSSGGRASIIVRSARPGETLLTLDGKERALVETDLVIADPEKAIALAGVMGGADTEVSPDTSRILLECAYFAPSRVRKTARRLALHSEASHRFERGCDPNGVLHALDRAAGLISDMSFTAKAGTSKTGGPDKPGTGVTNVSGGRVARGVIDVYPKKVAPAVVSLRPKRAAQLLGLSPKLVDEANVSKLLLALGLEVEGRDAEAIRFRVPTYRPDLLREVDLIEELLRLVGTDAVPASLPARAAEAEGLFDERRFRTLQTARASLEASGFDEAINLAFVSPQALDPFDGGDATGRITLRNPLGEEMSVLRKSLLPGLLQNVATNHRRGNIDVRLYETATVFLGKNPAGRTPAKERDGAAGVDAWAREVVRLSGVAAGSDAAGAFDRKSQPLDFFDVKGAIQDLLEALGVATGLFASPVSFLPADDRYPFLHPRARAEVWVRTKQPHWIGVVGEIHPDLVARHDIKGRAYGFELDVDALGRVAIERPRARPLPRFPAVRRDFALVVDEDLPAADLCARLADNGAVKTLLEGIDVFDVYRGDKLPEGKKSVAIALTLRAPDRTLTDEEINRLASVLLDDARAHFRAEVRG